MQTWWKEHITSPLINSLGRQKENRIFSKSPILIGGCGRSGTTLLLAIISAHPSVYAFPHEVDAFTSWRTKGGKLIPVRLDRLYRYLVTHKVSKRVTRWCEKRPFNVRFIGEILAYHGPDARFIHIVRDPRAVCTSKHPQKPGKYWVSIKRYVRDVSAGLEFVDHPQVLTIKYEDLILETGKIIDEICGFIGEDVHPDIISWYEHATVRKNKAWFDGLDNIQKVSLDKWKKSKNTERVKEILSDEKITALMKKLGYSI